MTAGSPVFVDTNILVYFTFAYFAEHQAARRRLSEYESLPVRLWTSRQVLREFLSVATRPSFLTPLPSPQFLAKAVEAFENRFEIAVDDREVTARLLELVENPGAQGKQVHDANIVATMRRHRIPYLVTHNTADFRRYAPWVSVLPLIP
jgi:predicted nucleic acid-binding protein